jgi:hypothetical protein
VRQTEPLPPETAIFLSGSELASPQVDGREPLATVGGWSFFDCE